MLVGTLILVAIVSSVLVAVMAHVAQEHRMLARTAAWNAALPVAEAGVEEAMSHMRQVHLGVRWVNGWTANGTNVVLTRTRTDGKYGVAISSDTPPFIYSTGAVWCASAKQFIDRRIVARTRGESYYMKAISAKQRIVLSGNFEVDSFDSANSSYSSSGMYDVTRRKAGGDVGTNESTPGAIDMTGNVTIYGRVATGPLGTVTISDPSKINVGSIAHVDGTGTGIEAGYYTKDMNVAYPDVTVPYTTGLPPINNSLLGIIFYKHILGSGDYTLATLSLAASEKMLVTGNARLVVDANVNINGTITIQPGASLQIYLKSGTVAMAGNGVRNETGYAYNVGLWCLPAVTSVTLSGEGQFTGTMYAPHAIMTLSGGGSSGIDFVGAVVAKTVTGSGKYKFHYDEDLQNRGMRNLTIASWKEM